ncbi:MAG: Metallophosphoesterase [Thermoleophilia bacterium]|nr:Metallophosphoesterase [Thermoleophilia bacterium]
MILIHAADLHLGSPLGGLDHNDQLPARRIRQAPMRAFERLAELCADRAADVLVIAGDLFDGDADLATMREAAQVLERICRAGTKVVTIRGNHDADSRMLRRLPAIDGLEQLPTDRAGTVRFDELGIAIHGRGFDTPRVLENIVLDYADAVDGALNVGLLHTSLAGAPGHSPYAPCTVADLAARGYQYWALGHVHKRQVHSEQPWIIHPGNTQGRDVGETGARGVTVVEFGDGQVLGTPEHVDLDEVRWSRLRVELEADEPVEDLIERVGEQLATIVARGADLVHLVRVELVGRGVAHDALDADPARWRDALNTAALEISPEGLYLERIKLRTSPRLPDREELLAREDFVGAAARELLDADPEPTPLDADAFAALDKKLGQLQVAAGGAELMPALSAEELAQARESLVGRLLVAHAQDAEVVR